MIRLCTVFSEIILAAVALYGAVMMNRCGGNYLLATIAFGTICISGLAGMFRFVLWQPPCSLIKIHYGFSWLGATVGLMFIAAQFYFKFGMYIVGQIHVIAAILLIIIRLTSDFRVGLIMSEFVSAVALFSILLITALYKSTYGCFGAICSIVAGLLVGPRGRQMGLPCLEMFYWCFTISIFAYTRAFLENNVK